MRLGLSDKEKDELVAFLEALIDPRVEKQSAPFDHPQLFVPNGHPTAGGGGLAVDGGKARDQFLLIPAVGRDCGAPIPTFLTSTGPLVPLPPADAPARPPPPAAAPPVAAPPAAAPPAAPAEAAARPKPVGLAGRRLAATRRGGTLIISAAVAIDGPATVHVRVVDAASGKPLTVLRSVIGRVTTGHPHTARTSRVAAARITGLGFRLRAPRARRPHAYRIVIDADNGVGTATSLVLVFRHQ